MTHSPAPWTAAYDTDTHQPSLNRVKISCSTDGPAGEITTHHSILDGCGCCESPWMTNPDDLPIILAAPELLAAAKALIKWDDGEYPGDREGSEMDRDAAIISIRAAIAKAEGTAA